MLGWIGVALIRNEELRAKQQVALLAEGRLLEITRSIDDAMSSLHRRMTQQLDQDGNRSDRLERLTMLERTEPHVRHTMWVSARGQLLYPPPPTSNADKEFLLYNELTSMARQRPQPISASAKTTGQMPTENIEKELSQSDSKWHQCFFDEGLQLVIWNALQDGSAMGCWLERSRWIADLIAMLPEIESGASDGSTLLIDADGTVVYRWGTIDIPTGNTLAEVALSAPLGSWRLRFNLPMSRANSSTWWNYWHWSLAISAVGLALLSLGAYVSFATTQQLRLANQRVSFAGQVSHELRTPLTNIRLYAEMAKRDLSQTNPDANRIAERLEVIDSESKRLSRLISGVLEFIQGRNKSQPLALQSVVPDETIRQVLSQCSLSLEQKGIVVSSKLHADHRVEMDSDILEQILINLVNNVEKYASSGKSLQVNSKIEDKTLTIEVLDAGPGIAPRFKNRVFQAFFRLDDSITAPSGTGLGLTIARAAARRHGGGLELVPSKRGAHFRLWLRIRAIDSIQNGVES